MIFLSVCLFQREIKAKLIVVDVLQWTRQNLLLTRGGRGTITHVTGLMDCGKCSHLDIFRNKIDRSIIQNQNQCFIWSIPSNSFEISLWKFIRKLKACPPKQIPFTSRLCDTVFLYGFQQACSCSSTGDVHTYRWLTYIQVESDYQFFDVGLHLSVDKVYKVLFFRTTHDC